MTLPIGSTAITDRSSGHELSINADGSINTNASFSASSVGINDGTDATKKATVDAGGNLHTLDANSAAVKTDLDSLVTNTTGLATSANQSTANTSLATIATNTTGVATQTTLAAAKADLDTIATNTTGVATAANQSTGNTNTSNIATATGGIADAAYTTGSGSLVAILKGIFGRIGATLGFDNTNVLKISNYVKTSAAGDTALTLGQATKANSLPITVASDQTVSVQRNCVSVYALASTQTSGTTQNSGDIAVGPYTEISLDINTTAQSGTNPTIQYFYERKGADGIYYILWQSGVLTAAANTLTTSIGAGMAYNQSLGTTGRIRWVIGGSATPTFTHSINCYGK